MKRFAIVVAGKVTAVTRASDALDPAWIEIPDNSPVGLGWLYDGTNFTAPLPTVVAADPPKRIRFQAVLDRMTQAEAIDYELAKVIDPAAGVAAKRAAAKWRVREAGLRGIGAFRLSSARLINFFNDMENVIIATGRAAEILSAPIQPDEEA